MELNRNLHIVGHKCTVLSWNGKNTMYIPSVMDRIYIMDNWIDKTLQSVRIFGTHVSLENNLAASDHYGVIAEVDFIK